MMKRVLGLFLALALLLSGGVPLALAAEDGADAKLPAGYTYTDWVVAEDFSTVTVEGKTYPLGSVLYRVIDGTYAFWHWWGEFLCNWRQHGEYTPDEWYEQQVIPKVRDKIQMIASYYPEREIVLINGRPWQETEWADEYLTALPEKARELAKDPTINGWLRDAVEYGVPVEQLRTLPRESIPVSAVRYRFYHTVDDFIADGADFTNEAKPKQKIAVSGERFFGGAPDAGEGSEPETGSDSGTGSDSWYAVKRLRMVMWTTRRCG